MIVHVLSIKSLISITFAQKKKMPLHEIEIMSPVGSFESLMAAIQGGAGSVYLGVGKLKSCKLNRDHIFIPVIQFTSRTIETIRPNQTSHFINKNIHKV